MRAARRLPGHSSQPQPPLANGCWPLGHVSDGEAPEYGHRQLHVPSVAGSSGAGQPAGQPHSHVYGLTTSGGLQLLLHWHWHVTSSRIWFAGHGCDDGGHEHLLEPGTTSCWAGHATHSAAPAAEMALLAHASHALVRPVIAEYVPAAHLTQTPFPFASTPLPYVPTAPRRRRR